MLVPLKFELSEIKQRSSSRSYQLGRTLYVSGNVSRLSVTENSATAIVSGSDDYHTTLQKRRFNPRRNTTG
ncbi:hypothetical protein [uncultured Psychromonas sp.]|uniref:SWIM zinc finger family protein n=1 Tax=uncultured Psychromonas sp. TaxID=173974 RepID=UPI00262956D1|nr:hypothetical protein [uncultured Psychromonas sp.]